MQRDSDFVSVTGEGFVDRVVDNLINHVVETGAVISVANVHAGPFAHRFEALQNLDRVGSIFWIILGLVRHGVSPCK